MFSIREQLWHRGSANAGLRSASRIHSNQLPTSVFGFVGNFCNEGRPASVLHRLGQHSSGKTLDVQVFDNDCAEVSKNIERLPMLVLVTQTRDSSVNLLEQSNRFASAIRAFLATNDPALCSTKFGFGGAIPARIRNRFAVGQGRKRFESNVNSNSVVERRQMLGFTFDEETDVPLAAFSLDCDGLDRARNWAMQLDFDFSDTLDTKIVSREFDAVPVTWKSDAIESATRLEARITSLLMSLDSKEERFEGFIYSSKDILAAREVRQGKIARRASFFQLVRLVVVVQRRLVATVSISSFLQCAVVDESPPRCTGWRCPKVPTVCKKALS